MIKTTTKNC